MGQPLEWTRGSHRKHPTLRLWLAWFAPSGHQIWQGRPFDDARFVYRLMRPDGTHDDFRLLHEARAAAIPREA